MPLEEALERGATALFGERYGEVVRVVSVGDYSQELCGGTHARAAGDIGLFRLVHEGGVAAGVRRVEALTGEGALAHARREGSVLREVGELTKAPSFQEAERVRRLLEQVKSLERAVRELKGRLARGESREAAYKVQRVGDLVVVVDDLRRDLGIEQLRERAEFLMQKEKSAVSFVASVSGGKVDFVASVAPEVTGRIHAGRLVKEVAAIVGGSGGGRADFAQGGGRDVKKAGAAVNSVYEIIQRAIGDGA
ncbi:MAG: DHHA1 domain-containing protein [Nitrospinota bacterium]